MDEESFSFTETLKDFDYVAMLNGALGFLRVFILTIAVICLCKTHFLKLGIVNMFAWRGSNNTGKRSRRSGAN